MSELDPNDQDTVQPLVTVAISAYNAEEYVQEAVESILAQTYSNLEIFVVDDGSSDQTARVVGSVTDDRVRLIRQDNSGKSVALNRVLDMMQGDFLVIQDADDSSHPERIEDQVRAFFDNPDIAGVFCGHQLILQGHPVAPRMKPRTRESCKAMIDRYLMPAHDPTLMVRASIAQDLRFVPDLRIGQGYDFILRLGERYPLLVLGRCLYNYRVYSKSATRSNAQIRQAYVARVLDAARERRGQASQEAMRGVQRWNSQALRDNNLVGHFVESIYSLRGVHAWRRALWTAMQCVSLRPLNWSYYKPLMACFAPKPLVDWWHRRKQQIDGGWQ